MILGHFEEQLLSMSFEMMLAQLMSMPVKFLIGDCIAIQDTFRAQEKELIEAEEQVSSEQIAELREKIQDEKAKQIKDLDDSMKRVKIPGILLERLKKEFDDSHSLSTQFGKSLEAQQPGQGQIKAGEWP